MSELYDRINNFCCLSAIRNRELFKDTDYKTVYDLVDDLSILRKQLEALEIIKEKKVDIPWLSMCKSRNEYNCIKIDKLHLTEEEYNLLKEVLK